MEDVNDFEKAVEKIRENLAEITKIVGRIAEEQGIDFEIEPFDLSKTSNRDLVARAIRIRDNETLWDSIPAIVHIDPEQLGAKGGIEKQALKDSLAALIEWTTRLAGPFS